MYKIFCHSNNIIKLVVTITICCANLLATVHPTFANPLESENSLTARKCLVGKVVNARFVPGKITVDGKFEPLLDSKKNQIGMRLTGISVIEAASPESREIRLEQYEGQIISVKGFENGSMIYSANIIKVLDSESNCFKLSNVCDEQE
jgi:hypothetical protein